VTREMHLRIYLASKVKLAAKTSKDSIFNIYKCVETIDYLPKSEMIW